MARYNLQDDPTQLPQRAEPAPTRTTVPVAPPPPVQASTVGIQPQTRTVAPPPVQQAAPMVGGTQQITPPPSTMAGTIGGIASYWGGPASGFGGATPLQPTGTQGAPGVVGGIGGGFGLPIQPQIPQDVFTPVSLPPQIPSGPQAPQIGGTISVGGTGGMPATPNNAGGGVMPFQGPGDVLYAGPGGTISHQPPGAPGSAAGDMIGGMQTMGPESLGYRRDPAQATGAYQQPPQTPAPAQAATKAQQAPSQSPVAQGQAAAAAQAAAYQVPQGYTLPDDIKAHFDGAIQGGKMTPQDAQQFINMHVGSVQRSQEAYRNAQQQAQKAQREGWLQAARNHPQYGGQNWDQSNSHAKAFVDQFGSDELRQHLSESGAGFHPGIFGAFANAGRFLNAMRASQGEDTLSGALGRPVGTSRASTEQDRLAKLYNSPDMQALRNRRR